MYCPECLNDSLYLSSRGSIKIIVNGKQMDSGRILFNIEKDEHEEMVEELKKGFEKFFKWYANFENKDPILQVALLTKEMNCDNNCHFGPNQQFSVVNILIRPEVVRDIVEELANKYKIETKIDEIV